MCGDPPREIDGVTLNSRYRPYSVYDSCELKFAADDMSKRLMLNFEKLDISNCDVELTISRTSGANVRLFHISSLV